MSTTLPLELTTLLVFWLCLSLWQRNFQVVARRLFIGLTLACAAWCLGDICYWSGLLDAGWWGLVDTLVGWRLRRRSSYTWVSTRRRSRRRSHRLWR